jgi:hypothetical protein
VIPIEHQDTIKVAALVGGMSIQKQERLLSYKPSIIVATPGRLWELLSDHADPYLTKQLPLIDVLVLDEADRMIADGHFKEMREILSYIYGERVKFKQSRNKKGGEKGETKTGIKEAEEVTKGGNFFVGKNLESKDGNVMDMEGVVDLFQDDAAIDAFEEEGVTEEPQKAEKKKGIAPKSKEELKRLESEEFDKEYRKVGGI